KTRIIDGTHCRIQRPKYAERDNICREGCHILNKRIVVDYDMKIRWTSLLYEQLKREEVKGVPLRDSAYAAEPFCGSRSTLLGLDRVLIINYLYNSIAELFFAEERYNRAICSARVLVEHAFEILKRQFHAECR
ncbi:unnamed protein product, partial [Haemonchus placei]|uniref:DDE_Tnp_1_7 domain-containing protein n=1 Tax=Haemonchus placei TaxID=6290 RepID=A0A0N4X3I4_HAEPC